MGSICGCGDKTQLTKSQQVGEKAASQKVQVQPQAIDFGGKPVAPQNDPAPKKPEETPNGEEGGIIKKVTEKIERRATNKQ